MLLNKVFEGWLERNDVSSRSTSEVLASQAEMFYAAVMGAPTPTTATPSPSKCGNRFDEAFGAEIYGSS